jgi:hypothetical protein
MRHSTKTISHVWILKVNDTTYLQIDYGMCDVIEGVTPVHTAMEASQLTDSEKNRLFDLADQNNAKWIQATETVEITFETEE